MSERAANGNDPDAVRQRLTEQLAVWRKQLINLSHSNRLLYFRRTRTSTLEIVREPEDLKQVVDRIVAGGAWRFFSPSDPDDTEEPEATERPERNPRADELVTLATDSRQLGTTLRTLERRATQEFMDKGIWILYLAAGMLEWTDPDHDDLGESPLVLVPIQLLRKSPREPYELRRAEEDVILNPALAVKLAEFGIELAPIDEDDLDLSKIFADFDEICAARSGWQVHRRLVVAPFSFHKEVMYRDLLNNQEAVIDHPLIQALALGANEGSEVDFEPIPEARLDELAPPERAVTILDADATQRQCIAAAAAGHSFVMDGPPGTGKSQTIANVIAELLGIGKTILFVSEKAAALEVVHKRLSAAGLDDYCLELHSHKATRKEVAQVLGAALGRHPVASRPMADLALAQLAQRRHELSARAVAMNVIRSPLGRSLHHTIGRIAQLDRLPQAPPPPDLDDKLSAERLGEILISSQEIARAWGPVERGGDFVWRDLVDTEFNSARHQRTLEQLDSATARLGAIERLTADVAGAFLVPASRDFRSSQALADLLGHLEGRPLLPEGWLSCETLDDVEGRIQQRRQHALAHGRAEKDLLEVVGSRWREIPAGVAGQLTEAINDLDSLSIRFEPVSDLPASELASITQFLFESAGVISAAQSDASTLASAFGLSTSGITLARASQLAELASFVGQAASPEPEWINPAIVSAVEHAARTLQPLCASFKERREQLGSVFANDVLLLDLESLCQRFAVVHKGFGKLKRQYRTDKATIASVARVGQASKPVVALLPQALEWQRLSQQLKVAEDREAALIGPYYYQSTESDFESLGRALESARRALEIAGRQLNADAMRAQLGRGGIPDVELPLIGARLTESIETWHRGASRLLGTHAGTLSAKECAAVAEWCRRSAAATGKLSNSASAAVESAGRPLSYGEVKRGLEARAAAAAAEESISATLDEDHLELGEAYRGLETNWDALLSSVDWAARLRELLGGPVSPVVAERLTSIALNWSELPEALRQWRLQREGIVSNFVEPQAREVRADLSTTFADASELLEHLKQTIGDIDEWVDHERAREQLDRLGVGAVIDFCESSRVKSTQVAEMVERACLERWSDTVIERDRDVFKQLRADQLDVTLDEFRRLDRELVTLAGGRVISACNERRPRTTVGAAGTVKREAEKQRRHMPVKKLLEAAGEVAQALKPCFMMSPLTVSQFLPPSLHFDAVVFDEASQVRPCDAINCIYRGTQLIVAGDDKQLPPTSFFEAVTVDGDDEWDEDQFDDFESVLQWSKGSAGLRELPLRWHYRSQHEDLIAYSNYSFYGGRLITFPGAAADAGDLGVKLYPVPDGTYRRGTARDNPKEAEVVVDRVMHWARDSVENPGRAATLGVVAFSEAQAAAIEVALDRRRETTPALDSFFDEDRLDGFFVKNLESVQGDERDIMIFSVGYGRDEVGKLTMNFGPLNRDGGQRRLNVAITRARRRVELVASITGTEREFNTSLREGPRHLQRYLDYAARGPVALALELGETALDAESPFEEEVIRTIRSWGYRVQPQVGTASYRVDVGVWHPDVSGRFVLGVECDGRMYHSSTVARDRDRLRQEVLERLGWRIYRIWGTSWYRNRFEQEERLKAAIEDAISAEDGGTSRPLPTPPPSRPSTDERFEIVPLDVAPTWTVEYPVASPSGPRPWFDMHLPESQPEIRRMILEIVDLEGPIEDELLLRRVREAWQVGRAGSRIRDAFNTALQDLVHRRQVIQLDWCFNFRRSEQLQVVRVPGDNPLARRTVAQVPLVERKLAVSHLVADARRVSRDELTLEVCRLFGWNRRGADIAAALNEAVDELVHDGLIIEDGDCLKPPLEIATPKRDPD